MRALLVALVLSIAPAKALACSCAPPPAPKKALAQADAVFTGEITSVMRVAKDGTRTPFDPETDLKAVDADMRAGKPFPTDQVEVAFAVDRAWKGVDAGTVVLQTGVPVCCICIIPFRAGETWMIYANGKKGYLSTSQCSRSTQLAHAKADLAALGKPAMTFAAAPTPAASPVETPAPGTVAKAGIDKRSREVTERISKRAQVEILASTKGKLVDACAGRFTQTETDEWALTTLAPAGTGALSPDTPRIERWIVPAKGPAVKLDWTRAEDFSTTSNAEESGGRFFYGELKCVKPAERAAFVGGFLEGFERPEAKSVDLKTGDSACFSFDSVYNNWQCFGWSKEKNAFVRWGYQAAAD